MSEDSMTITNCVISANIANGKSQIFIDSNCTLDWKISNKDVDPLFVNPGYWDSNSTPTLSASLFYLSYQAVEDKEVKRQTYIPIDFSKKAVWLVISVN